MLLLTSLQWFDAIPVMLVFFNHVTAQTKLHVCEHNHLLEAYDQP